MAFHGPFEQVSEMWRHEDYNSNIITNDVSVLR